MSVEERIKRGAEQQMRRSAPDSTRPLKRTRNDEEASAPPVHAGYFQYNVELGSAFRGFLLTTKFHREKSAIKELRVALHKFLQRSGAVICAAQTIAVEQNLKKVDRRPDDQEGGLGDQPKGKLAAAKAEGSEGAASGHQQNYSPELAVIKVAGSGVGLLQWTRGEIECGEATTIIKRLHADIQSRACSQMEYCQRVLPVERLSLLQIEDLKAAARYLGEHFLDTSHPQSSNEVQFAVCDKMSAVASEVSCAVAFKTRAHEGHSKDKAAPSREEVIKALATGFMGALSGKRSLTVNLGAPQVVLAAEAVVVGSQVLCAIGLLPEGLVCLKPRLGVASVCK